MIPAADLIAIFRRMYEQHWRYEWGAARRGCVDCSGAFVYAYRQFGLPIYHGSNTIARRHVGAFQASPVPGYAAFKWRKTDTAKFPDGRGDFYHIGLVSEDGAHVYEARGEKAGFVRSDASAWHSFAPLVAVSYGEHDEDTGGEGVIYSATVTTNSGSLNIRSGPGTDYPVIGKLPRGEEVDILQEYDLDGDGAPDWGFMGGDGKQGYVSLRYLTRETPEPSPLGKVDAEPPQEATQTIEVAEEVEGEVALRWAVFVPCDSREEAEALQAARPGAILTAFKPPDDERRDSQ